MAVTINTSGIMTTGGKMTAAWFSCIYSFCAVLLVAINFHHYTDHSISITSLSNSSMGLFDKAKGAFKDLEQQLDKVSKAVQETGLSNSETKELQRDLHIVNQQAARLGVNDTPNISETSSVPSTVVLTPASSIAPKKMATKLPLAIRKEGTFLQAR